MRVKLLQTADPDRYKPMLDITAPAARRFCEIQGIEYCPFVGIKRGCQPWHAVFNRIVMLSELIEAGYRGWVIYLDADAYPFDVRFDLAAYLARNRKWAVIGAAGDLARAMPNSGILLLNLAKQSTRDVLQAWQAIFDSERTEEQLRAMEWGGNGDQALLHRVLHARGDVAHIVKIESFDLIGWPQSRFLRQELREFGTFTERCDRLRAGVEEALREGPAAERLIAAFRGR